MESFHLTDQVPGKTRDKVASFAGVSGRTVEKIANVIEASETDREWHVKAKQWPQIAKSCA